MDLDQQLATVPLLSGLETRVQKRLAEIGKRRTYQAEEVIVREGTTATALYIVLSGHARVERNGTKVAEVGAGDFFGELALIEEHPRTATVTATEPTDCLLFPAWEFTSLLGEHPEIAVPIMRELIARSHRAEHHGA